MRFISSDNSASIWLGRASELIFYLLLLLTPFAYGTVEPWSLALSHLLVYSIIIIFLLHNALSGRPALTFPSLPVLLLLLLGWAALSTFTFSIYRYNSLGYLFRIADYLLVAFYVSNRFHNAESRGRLISAITVLGVLVASLGLLVYYLDNNPFLRRLFPVTIGASAPYVNHNHFAGYLEMSLVCAAGLLCATYRKIRLEFSILIAPGVLLIFLGILFSLSRGGILSILIVCGIFVIFRLMRKGRMAAVTPAVGLIVISLGYLWVLETESVEARLKTLEDSQAVLTLNQRTVAWKGAIRAIGDNPLAGYGPGNFATIFPRYREPGITRKFFYAHNDYLQYWVEFGLAGILILLAGLTIYGRKLWYLVRKSREREEYLILGAAGGIMALLLHSLIDFNLNLHANAMLFIVLAALLGISVPTDGAQRQLRLPFWPVAVLSLGLVVLGARFSLRDWRADLAQRNAARLLDSSPLEAAELYRSAGRLVPENADHLYKLGYANTILARKLEIPFYRTQAESYFEASLSLNPYNSEVWLAKAMLEAENGNYGAAEKLFQAAIENDPNNPACYFYWSNFSLIEKDFQKAARVSQKGISLAPNFFIDRVRVLWGATRDIQILERLIPDDLNAARYQLAEFLFGQRQYAESLEQLRLCDERTRREHPCYFIFGRNFLALQQPDSAEFYFKLGIEKNPQDVLNYRHLSNILLAQGRVQEADSIFEAELGSSRHLKRGPLLFEYALYSGKKRDYTGQRKLIREALDEEINNIQYILLLADAYLAEDQFYEALKELRRAEMLFPENLSVLKKEAVIYEKMGQKDRAEEYCRKILSLAPDDGATLEMSARLTGPESGVGEKSDGI